MRGQRLQSLVGLVRADDVHELDLLELVLAQHPPRVLAVRPRLAPEAGRVAYEPHRQIVRLQDPLARDVGDRDLGGRDQVQVVLVDPEQVVDELRELSGAAQHVGRDEIRDVDLPVAVLAGVHVDHELDERAVQAREPPAQGDEPAPGELRRQLEVERAERDAEVGVVLRLEVEARRLPDPALLAVVVLVPALGHGVVGEIGDLEGDALDLGLELRKPGLPGLQLVAEPRHVREQRLDVLAPRPWRARSPSSGCCVRAEAPGCAPGPPCARPRAG